MSVFSDPGPGLRNIPRLLLLLLGWYLLCSILEEVVPAAWMWMAFPVVLLGVRLLAGSRLRLLTSLFVLILLPLLLRRLVTLFPAALAFDNGWLLTAPWLYAAAVSSLLLHRYPGWRVFDMLPFLAFTAWALASDSFAPSYVGVPALATLRVLLALLSVILAALNLLVANSRRPVAIPAPATGTTGRIGTRPRGSTVLYGAVMLVLMLLLAASGLRLRRDDALREGGGVLAGDLFRFDFNEVLSLEPEISLNSELTMLYREDGPAVPRYLRRYTLSGWDDSRGFYRDGDMETDYPGLPPRLSALPRGPVELETAPLESRTEIDQEYYLIALDPSSLFALNLPVDIEPWIIWDDASFSRAYAVRSLGSVAGPWDLYSAGTDSMDSEWLEYYLSGGDDDAFRALALEAAGDADGAWETARFIERWFHENYYYSLQPGVAPDGDQLSWFLYETRRGYCSYYAFAMTRMCRSLGIPARVAVGFVTDPEAAVLGFVPVRSDQAHAWVEVWLDGFGWIEFDPTSQVMAPGEEYPFQFINPDKWLPLVEEVLSRSGEIDVALATEEDPVPERSWRVFTRRLVTREEMLPLLGLLVLVLVYLPGRIIPGARLALSGRSPDLRRRIRTRWRGFALRMARAGYPPMAKETVAEWARRLEDQGAPGFARWTDLYLKAVFSPRITDTDIRDFEGMVNELKNYIRSLSPGRRLRSFLSPGWKGGLPWR